MTVEFINAIATRKNPEFSGADSWSIDSEYLRHYVRTLEEVGFDYTLVPYGSSGPDAFTVATAAATATETLKPIVALRPNIIFPTVAAQALASLDQISGGRATTHIISGGSEAEQRRQGDYLDKPQRYARSAEFIRILRDSWSRKESFSHEGEFYRFEDFGPGFPTHSGRSIPVSVGGLSPQALRIGGEQGDIFGLWGEPLAETKSQIDAVNGFAEAAGRVDRPRFWVTFRAYAAPTEAEAWQKAHAYLDRVQAFSESAVSKGGVAPRYSAVRRDTAENVASQRLIRIADRGERHDRALWSPAATAGAGGSLTALVGDYETVAAAILDYVDFGASLVSLPTGGDLDAAIDHGRHLIPLVHQELRHRAATRPAAARV